MRNICLVAILGVFCLLAGPASAAVDIFLKLDGIQGESADDKHRNEIDVLSLAHDIAAPGSTARPSLVAPRPGVASAAPASRQVGPITITKFMDAASPHLMTRCNTQEKIASAVLVIRKPGGRPIEFMKATLQGVTVTSYQVSVGSGIERPTETVSFSFDSIQWDYVRQNADGSAGAATSTTYNGR